MFKSRNYYRASATTNRQTKKQLKLLTVLILASDVDSRGEDDAKDSRQQARRCHRASKGEKKCVQLARKLLATHDEGTLSAVDKRGRMKPRRGLFTRESLQKLTGLRSFFDTS